MRKVKGILSLALLIALFITGCNSNQADKEAIQAAETYKIKEYTVKASDDLMSVEAFTKRNEELKPFFTEAFYEKAVSTGYTGLALQAAYTQQASVRPENLKFTVSDQKDYWIDLKYTADLVFADQTGTEVRRTPLEGIMTLFQVDSKWLVQGDRFDNAAFHKLINR